MKINNASLKEFILNNYSQTELFSRYMGITEGDILNCVHNNKKVINPLRMEENASLSFNYYDNKLRMYDYGSIAYRGDIFDLVGLLINENPNNGKSFINICKYIINGSDISGVASTLSTIKEKRENTIIKFTPRHWKEQDIKFWMIGVHTSLTLLTKENVYPVNEATIYSARASHYLYKASDPSYAYFFDLINNESLIKLYFPMRSKDKIRFITNNKYNFEGIGRLYKTDYLVITKSYKDRVLLRNYLPSNYCVTNFSSESVRLQTEQALALKTIYKAIFVNVDYDSQGICNSYWHYYKYKFIPIFISNSFAHFTPGHIEGLVKMMNNKDHHYNNENVYERLIIFKTRFAGETDSKDIYDLAKISPPSILKEYITNKFINYES